MYLMSVLFLFLQWKAEEKPVKIDKWDCSALKNALDDAAKKVVHIENYLLLNYF